MQMWKKWDGETDLKKPVLVKTKDGTMIVAQQPSADRTHEWVVYTIGISVLSQPLLKDKVIEYIDMEEL